MCTALGLGAKAIQKTGVAPLGILAADKMADKGLLPIQIAKEAVTKKKELVEKNIDAPELLGAGLQVMK